MASSLQSAAIDATASVTALADPDWKTRWQACQMLGELGDKCALRPLIKVLDDSNQWVRIVAAEALGQIGDREATQALMYGLDDDSIWVRRACVVALGQIADEEAIPPLVNRLLDPPNNEWPEELRDAVADALGTIGGMALETLIYALEDPEPWVSCAAARALGKIGDPQAITPLSALTKQKHSMVRSAATQALAQITDARAVRAALSTDEAPRAFWKLMALKEIDESTINQLRGFLDDADERIRVQAAEVLSHLGDENSAKPLTATFRSETRSTVTQERGEKAPETQMQPMARQSNGTGPLVVALGDPVAEVRLAATEALGQMGDPSAIPALSQALHDTDSRIRAAAARSMGLIGARQSGQNH